MNKESTPADVQKKPFAAPALRRDGRMPVVTAGSFDLFIPNAPPAP